ncbi:MAG: hypothetical protein WCH44_00550 [Betaproteobacteria bacterium]
MATKKTTPIWSDVKFQLTDVDRTGLLGLVQDLYAASKGNQLFLHTRFDLGGDVLKPYKATIELWLWPDLTKKTPNISVSKAKKAVADYKKAIGQPQGLAELTVFYCERAIGFANKVGLDDDAYCDALVRMFELALKYAMALPGVQRDPLLDRLDTVRQSDRNICGWLADELLQLWLDAGFEE